MNIIKKFKNATDKSKFGGIIYLIYFGLIIYVAVYLVLALFSCIFYKKLTPDEYEVGYLKSYTAYDTTTDRTDDTYRGYELTVTFYIQGKKYTADLDVPAHLRTKVTKSGMDANHVIGDIYYKKSNPKKVKIVKFRRHVLPFSGNKYICKDNLDEFYDEVIEAYKAKDYEKLAEYSYLGEAETVNADIIEQELADDYSYFSESEENFDSLKYTRFKSDETRYLNVSSSDGKGIAYYITVKNGKYKLDLRYRT